MVQFWPIQTNACQGSLSFVKRKREIDAKKKAIQNQNFSASWPKTKFQTKPQ
jgi:hypothetical protein